MLPRTHLPSLAILRSFEAAARHQSFTLAAEELGLTQGAISRQVRDLETQIGAQLFARVGRAVQLTQAGHALSKDVTQDLDHLRQTVSRAITAGDSGRVLNIAVLPTFGARWLIPRLADFRARHPDIQLSFTSRTEPFDLASARCDLAVHFGRDDWPSARLVPLCPENLLAVGAPQFLDQRNITNGVDVLSAPLLHLASRPTAWGDFRTSQGIADNTTLNGLHFDQFSLIISACTHGMGAALLPLYLIEEELAQGTLRVVAKSPSPDKSAYFIATPLGETRPETAAFVRWLRRQIPRRAG